MSDLHELVRELVTLPGWRWMPGMRAMTVSGHAIVIVEAVDGRPVTWWSARGCRIHTTDDPRVSWPGAIPDLTDPATVGCLLALVREAMRRKVSTSMEVGHGWGILSPASEWVVRPHEPTEPHALVAALRAAVERAVAEREVGRG